MRALTLLAGIMCFWIGLSNAQTFSSSPLVFHGVNKFIDDDLREPDTSSMSSALSALRGRLITIPPQKTIELLPLRFYEYALTVAERYDIPRRYFLI
jgi:hypothetical protein